MFTVCKMRWIFFIVLAAGVLYPFNSFGAGFFGRGKPGVSQKQKTVKKLQFKSSKDLAVALVEAICRNDTAAFEQMLNPGTKVIIDRMVAQKDLGFADRKDFLNKLIKELQHGLVEEFEVTSMTTLLHDKNKISQIAESLCSGNDRELFVREKGQWFLSFEFMEKQAAAGSEVPEKKPNEDGCDSRQELAKEFLFAVFRNNTGKFWKLLSPDSRKLFEEELAGSDKYSSRQELLEDALEEIRKQALESSGIPDMDVSKMLENEEVVRLMVNGMLQDPSAEKMLVQINGRWYLDFAAYAGSGEVQIDYSSKQSIARSFIIAVVKNDVDMMWKCFSPGFQELLESKCSFDQEKLRKFLVQLIEDTQKEIKQDYSLQTLDGFLENQRLMDSCVKNITHPSKRLFKEFDGKWYIDSRE